MSLPSHHYVDSTDGLHACLNMLRTEPRMAVDIEANSLYAYRERVCLIQISIPDQGFIIDPLAGMSLDELGRLFSDEHIEKVFHASDYDLKLLKLEYDWEVSGVFDTMWAAQILGYTNMGLAWFLREFYGVTKNKRHQKANWSRRPLSNEELEYAQMDTHYLLQLSDDLRAKLEDADRLNEAQEVMSSECGGQILNRCFDPEGFWKIKGVRKLDVRGQAVLRSLFLMREDEAKRRDQPPFKVLTNEILLNVARVRPETETALHEVPQLSERVVRRLGNKILDTVTRGLSEPTPMPPRREPVSPIVTGRYDQLVQWRKEQAKKRKVKADVIINQDSMWMVAHQNPATLESMANLGFFGPCRLALYGEDILALLA